MFGWLNGKAERERQFSWMRDTVQDVDGCADRNRTRAYFASQRAYGRTALQYMADMQNASMDYAAMRGYSGSQPGSLWTSYNPNGLNCGKWDCRCTCH